MRLYAISDLHLGFEQSRDLRKVCPQENSEHKVAERVAVVFVLNNTAEGDQS